MDEEQGTSQATPQEQPQANPTTDISELDGLLGEPEEQAEEQGEQPEQPEAEDKEQPPAFTDETEVALDDGRKVSVREMKETFATFTRKTQELAEAQRTTVAQAREAVASYAERQAQELHLMAQHVEQLVAPGMDQAALMRLAYEDPNQYQQVKARLDVAREMRANMQQQVQSLMQQAQEQRERAEQEQVHAHQQLVQAESQRLAGQKWFNDDFKAKALAFARKHGIPEQIARGVAYAGFVEITRKAMLYEEAMARTKGGKQPPTQSVMTPGASPARGAMTKAKQVADYYARAQKTGNRADIGRYLEHTL